MKHKTKRMWRSVIALALTFTLVFGTAGTAFATSGGVQVANEETATKEEINYVSIGDSMANGYGFVGYKQNSNNRNDYDIMTGKGMYGEGAYPLQFEDYLEGEGYTVNHTKLATSAMLADDLLFLLDGREEFDDGWNGWRDYVGTYSDEELKAHFQKAIEEADVITMGLGNASFGAFMLDRVTNALGVMGGSLEGEPELSLEAAVATMELDEEQHALVMEVYEELIAELVNKVPADIAEEFSLEQVTDIVTYVVASHVVGYKLVLDKIIEMNPDVEIVLVGLLNTTYGMNITDENGNVLVPFGDVMDNAFEAMNSYMTGLPTAMQVAGKWQDAKFYYAAQPNPEFICMEFKNLSENGWDAEDSRLDGATVRDRNIDAYNGNLRYIMGAPFAAGINAVVPDVVKGMVPEGTPQATIDEIINATLIKAADYGENFEGFLPSITLADVENFEANKPEKWAENGNFNNEENRKNLSIALYLGIEHGVAQSTDTMDIPLEGLITIATSIESAFEGFYSNLGSPVAVAEEMGTYLTSTDVLKGMCKIYGLFKVGNGMSVHPTPAAHDKIAASVISAYEAGYTTTDKTVEDLKVLAGYLADKAAEYYDEAYAYAYEYAKDAGYIADAKAGLTEVKAALAELTTQVEGLDLEAGQIKELTEAIANAVVTVEALEALIDEADVLDEATMTKAMDLLNTLETNLTDVGNILAQAGKDAAAAGNDAAIKAIEEAQKVLDAAWAKYEELKPVVIEKFNEAVAKGTEFLMDKLAEAGDAFNKFVEAAKVELAEYSAAAAEYVYNWLVENPGKVIALFVEYGDDAVNFIMTYQKEIAKVIEYLTTEFGDDVADYVMAHADTIMKELVDLVKENGDKAWALIEAYISELGGIIDGTIENVDSAVKEAITALMTQMDEYAKEAANKVWKAIKGDEIVDLANAVIKTVDQAIADLEAAVEKLEAQIADLQAQLEELKAELKAANDAAKAEIEKQIAEIEKAIEKLEAQIAAIEKAIEDLNAYVKDMNAAVEDVIAAANGTYEDLVAAVETLKDVIADIAATIADVEEFVGDAVDFITSLEGIGADIEAALAAGNDYIAKKVDEAYKAFVNAVYETVKEQAPKAAEFVYNWLVENPDKVIGFFAEYGDDMIDFIADYQDEILAVLGYIASEYGDDVMNYVMDNADVILPVLVDLIKEHGDDAWKLIDAYLDELGVYEAAEEAIKDALATLYAQIEEFAAKAAEKVCNAIDKADIVEKLQAAVDAAEKLVADLENMIADIEAQIDALQAQLDKLYADLEKASGEVKAQIEKQIAAIENAIAKLEAQIAAIEKTIADLKEAIAKADAAIKEIINATGATYEEIVAALEAVKDAFAEIADIVADVEGYIAEMIDVIKALNEAVKDANAQIKEIVDTIESLLGIELPTVDFEAIDEMIKEALAEGAEYLAKKVDEAYDAFVEAVVAAVKEQAPKAAEFVYNWLVNNPDVVIGFFAEYGDDMIDFIVDNQDAIMEVLNWLVAEYGDEVADFVMDNADVILAALVELVAEYGDEAWTLIEAYLTELGALPVDTSMITGALEKLAEMIEGFGPAVMNQLSKVVEGVANNILGALEDLEDAVKSAVDEFIAELEAQIAELEAMLNELYAAAEKATGELKAQIEKQIAQIEKQIASLKAQIAAIENLLNELYDAVKDAEAAVKDLIEALNNKAIADVKAALKEIMAAMDAVKEAIDYVASVVDEINSAIAATIEIIEAIEDAVKEVVDTLAAIDANVRNTIETVENTVAAMKAALTQATEDINNYVDGLQAMHEEMYAVATHGEYNVTEDSFYVALGDAYAEDSYAAKLAAELDMEDQFYDANINGMRAEDLLYFLDENYEADAYAQANFGGMLEEKRAELTEVIGAADLITLNFSNNTMTEFMLNQTMAALDGQAADMDWTQYLSDKEAALVEEALAEMTAYFEGTGLDASMAAVLTTAVESYAYAYVGFAATCGDAVDAIKAINPDAQIVVVGMYNPFDGAVLTSGDTEIVLGDYVDYLVDLCNIHSLAGAMMDGDYVYVAAPDVEINKPFGENVDAIAFLTDFVLNGFESLQPSDAGHEYIKDQILGALDITTKAANEAEEAFKALDELGEITLDNLEDAKAAVEAARDAFDALTDEEKEAFGIDNYNKIVEAEKTIAEIEIAEAEKENAANKEVLNELKAKLEQAELDLAEIERVLAVTKSRVAKVTVTNNKSTVKAQWTEVEGADRYAVKLYRNGKKVGKTKYTNKTYMNFTDQLRGGKYKVVVSPFAKALGANYYGFEKASNVRQIKLLKPTVKTTKVGKYTRIKAADQNSTGFQIYISKDKKFNKKDTLITVKTDKKALNKKLSNKKYFKKGKTYIKVRAYSTINGKKVYGKWSNIKTIKR